MGTRRVRSAQTRHLPARGRYRDAGRNLARAADDPADGANCRGRARSGAASAVLQLRQPDGGRVPRGAQGDRSEHGGALPRGDAGSRISVEGPGRARRSREIHGRRHQSSHVVHRSAGGRPGRHAAAEADCRRAACRRRVSQGGRLANVRRALGRIGAERRLSVCLADVGVVRGLSLRDGSARHGVLSPSVPRREELLRPDARAWTPSRSRP